MRLLKLIEVLSDMEEYRSEEAEKGASRRGKLSPELSTTLRSTVYHPRRRNQRGRAASSSNLINRILDSEMT